MKFNELTYESQNAAREVLASILKMDWSAHNSFDEDRAVSTAHIVRKAFIALEAAENTDSPSQYNEEDPVIKHLIDCLYNVAMKAPINEEGCGTIAPLIG